MKQWAWSDVCLSGSFLDLNKSYVTEVILFRLLSSQSKLNMESMTKPELLMLFSILEGELEARDLVIDALKVPRVSVNTHQEWLSAQLVLFQ